LFLLRVRAICKEIVGLASKQENSNIYGS